MQAYIIKRVLLFVPTLVLVGTIAFVIIRLLPGDPALHLLETSAGFGTGNVITEEALAKKRAELGTDKPLFPHQWADFLWGSIRLDFGDSFNTKQPVIDEIKNRFPVTLELVILSLVMAAVVAVPLGVFSAVSQDTPMDYLGRLVTTIGIAMPNFWVALLMLLFLASVFDWNPPLRYEDFQDDPIANLQQMVFPSLVLALSHMAFLARITRSAMLEVLREDYIRTARAKGLSERVVINRHTLRNALLPVITVTGYEFGRLIGGTVIIESIFLTPGIGLYVISGFEKQDFPVIQAVVIIVTLIVLVLNLVMDLTYSWLNPRIRYS